MTIRRKNNAIDLDEIAPGATAVPGIDSPPGVAARVRTTIDYTKTVDPDADTREQYNRQSFQDIANEESVNLAPPDQLTEFLEDYSNFTAYQLMVLRQPDPAPRRIPGQTYHRPNFVSPENLGAIAFSPNPSEIISTLQLINGNSGGVFQLWLTDLGGRRVMDAPSVFVAVADPMQPQTRTRPSNPQYEELPQYYPRQLNPAPAPPQKSESEAKLDALKDDVFQRLLLRALEPPPPPPPAQLPADQTAALYVMQNTDFFKTMFDKMASMASAAEAPGATGWKDRLAEAGMNLATQNPEILQTVTQTIGDIIGRIFPGRPAQPQPAPVQQFQQRQPMRLQPTPQPQAAAPPITSNSQYVAPPSQVEIDSDPTEDEIEMDILEEIITLLNSTKPLQQDEPVLAALAQEYPQKFYSTVQMVAATPMFLIIQYVGNKSPLYESMLDAGTPGGQHLRKRFDELKNLCVEALKTPQQAPPQQAPPVVEYSPDLESDESEDTE